MQQIIFIADLIAFSTCFGHHYAHHQELDSIIQKVAACSICCFKAAACKPDTQPSAPHHTDNVKTKAPNTTGSNYLYNTVELLMMGIMVPETCWASNKICSKNHLLHLVGILFPQIMDIICHFVLKITRNFGLPVAVTKIWRIEFQRLVLSRASLFIHFDINEMQFIDWTFLFYKLKKTIYSCRQTRQ